jgi:hypothetical protein
VAANRPPAAYSPEFRPLSRPLLILIVAVVALVAGAVLLASKKTETPQTRVEKPVLNEALAR